MDEEGYCIVPGVVPPDLLARLREETAGILGGLPKGHEDDNRSTGSMVTVYESPVFADLIALPEAREALRSTGFHDAKFSSGYIISKPPKSPRLFWHYDWAGWDAPESFTVRPTPQLFFMYYLTDTRRENGCLRVVPRSHIEDNDLSPCWTRPTRPNCPRGGPEPSSLQRPSRRSGCSRHRGRPAIGDAPATASHANQSNERRTVITLWFHPDPDTFGERLQAFCANMVAKTPADWPDEAKAKLEAMVCRYAGSAEPWPWNRHRPFPARVGA